MIGTLSRLILTPIYLRKCFAFLTLKTVSKSTLGNLSSFQLTSFFSFLFSRFAVSYEDCCNRSKYVTYIPWVACFASYQGIKSLTQPGDQFLKSKQGLALQKFPFQKTKKKIIRKTDWKQALKRLTRESHGNFKACLSSTTRTQPRKKEQKYEKNE